MSCWCVNSFDFSREKCTSASARVQFSQRKIERINTPTRHVCFDHASAFYTSNNTVKMLMNNKFNKFKAQTLTGNPTGNYSSQLLASRALNMSCSFSQSVHSIESRCVANSFNKLSLVLDAWFAQKCMVLHKITWFETKILYPGCTVIVAVIVTVIVIHPHRC